MTTIDTLLNFFHKTTSDSETLAYLLILGKTLKPADITSELQGALCQAIKSSFLHRLLKSKGNDENIVLFREIALNILVSLFLRREEKTELCKMIPDLIYVSQVPTQFSLHPNIIKVLAFICTTEGPDQKLHILHLLCKNPDFIFESPSRKNWSHFVARLISMIPTFCDSPSGEDTSKRFEFDQTVLLLLTTCFSTITEGNIDVDEKCCRMNCMSIIFNADQTLFKRTDFSKKFKLSFSELLKRKLSVRSRSEILGVGPLISSQFNLDNSTELLVILYRLSTIELKLQLEKVVQEIENKEDEDDEEIIESKLGNKDETNPIYLIPDEENEDPNVSEKGGIGNETKNNTAMTEEDLDEQLISANYCIVNCCQTIENAMNQLVNGNAITPHTQSLIDSIRMAMSSVMFFLQKRKCSEHPTFKATARLFAYWLTEDTGDLKEIKMTLRVLLPIICQDKKDLLPLFVSAIVNQMENESFSTFVEKELCPDLIQFTLYNLWEEVYINLVPIFNELLSQEKYPPISESASSLPFTIKLPGQINFRYLSTVQLQTFIFICNSNSSSKQLQSDFSPVPWLNDVLTFILSPFRDPLLPHNGLEIVPPDWSELKDIWLSTVHSVCLSINLVPDHSILSCDLTSLASKCSNYSETCNEVTGSLETLLATLTV